MSTPLVSVVIPAYNEEKYITRCLEALKHQSFKNFETLVVIQGSDRTAAICKSYGCCLIFQKTPSISLARATGFAAAKGQIIASTDADSQPCPDWIKSIAALAANPKYVGITGPTPYISHSPSARLVSLYFLFISFIFRTLFNYVIIWGNNFAVKKSVYRQTTGFDSHLNIFEDMDIGNKIRRFGQIKFSSNVSVFVSARRLEKEGLLKFGFTQIRDNLIFIFSRRTRPDYEVIR